MFQAVLRRLRDAQNAELEGGATAESGFTLIELMVVLLIIAILLAIAIPTFLGVTGSANDRAAQSNLTNALTEVSAVYQGSSQSFSGITTTIMSSSAPEFAWQASNVSPTAGSKQVSLEPVDVSAAADGQGVVLADLSKNSSTCWYAVTLQTAPTTTMVAATDAPNIPFESTTYTSTGATTAGTFYAKLSNATAAQCKATYTQTTGFAWGSSYSSPGAA
jgi:type IV pilus assembly protein PilA